MYAHILNTILVTPILAVAVVAVATSAFVAARVILPLTLQIPVLSSFLRPFLAHFTRGSFFPNLLAMPFRYSGLAFRAYCLSSSTLFLWESSSQLFEHLISQPVSVVSLFPEPTELTLASGIASTNDVFKYFAYRELRNLSAAQRTALFTDQKYNPSMWSHLVKQSLLVLGEDYQLCRRRGEAAPLPPPIAVAPVSQPTLPPPSTPIRVQKQAIFRSSAAKQSPIRQVLDSLASDGSVAQAVDEVVENADKVPVPDFFRNAPQKLPSLPAPTEAEIVQSTQTKLLDGVKKYLPWVDGVGKAVQEQRGWLTQSRMSKQAQMSLPRKELDLAIVQGTSTKRLLHIRFSDFLFSPF